MKELSGPVVIVRITWRSMPAWYCTNRVVTLLRDREIWIFLSCDNSYGLHRRSVGITMSRVAFSVLVLFYNSISHELVLKDIVYNEQGVIYKMYSTAQLNLSFARITFTPSIQGHSTSGILTSVLSSSQLSSKIAAKTLGTAMAVPFTVYGNTIL